MRVLSLFSGGGLGDYGLELAGMEIVGQVEIDEYCQKILALRWPHVPKWRDVREVHGAFNCPTESICENCVPGADLVSGGFPCQDISSAGKGAGIGGERSGLWKEMFRIIREVRPRYVLVENVSALLSRGLGVVLGDLAEIGYDAEWDCIPASALGAPHQRDRVWIVAYASSERDRRENREFRKENGRPNGTLRGKSISASEEPNNLADATSRGARELRNPRQEEGSQSGDELSRISRRLPRNEDVANAISNTARTPQRKKINGGRADDQSQHRYILGGNVRDRSKTLGRFWEFEPNVGRVAHGVAKRVDRLKLLGNGQVVQVVQYIGEKIMEFDK